MEARVHEDRGHSGEAKVPNTSFGFILPDSITLLFCCGFLSVLLYLLQIIATCAFLPVFYKE